MIQLTYRSEVEYDNTKGIIVRATFLGTYGVQGVGDLMNMAPVESGNPGGIVDPKLAYNTILAQPPSELGVFSENIGGYYVNIKPNAIPTLTNTGLIVYSPGGNELNTNQVYPAALLAGYVDVIFFVPALQ